MVEVTPYLVRAYHQWMEDAGFTAHILVDCSNPEVVVPEEFIQDERIVLNIASTATQSLILDNEYVNFKARFSNQSIDIFIPIGAIMGIYTGENGEGMFFERKEATNVEEPKPGLTLLD
jgi:stringent starvation protein B